MNLDIMAEKVIDNVEANREEWKKLRKTTIGSSEIVSVCGLNPYQTPLDLWAKKTGRIEEDQENEFMRLGRYMEPFIGGLFQRETSKETWAVNALYRHPTIKFATASPDFFCKTDETGLEVVETKNVSYYRHADWQDGNVPNAAHMQLIWQLGVLGLRSGYLAALVGASPLNFYTPHFDFSQELFDQMIELASRFLVNVEQDTPPAAQSEDRELLERLNTRKKDKEIDLPEKAGELLHDYAAAKKMLKSAEASLEGYKAITKNIEAQLLQMLGDAAIGHYGEAVVKANRIETKGHFVKGSAYTRVTIKLS